MTSEHGTVINLKPVQSRDSCSLIGYTAYSLDLVVELPLH